MVHVVCAFSVCLVTGWMFATRYLGAVSHKLIVIFLGGLRLTDDMVERSQVIAGKKLKRVRAWEWPQWFLCACIH